MKRSGGSRCRNGFNEAACKEAEKPLAELGFAFDAARLQ